MWGLEEVNRLVLVVLIRRWMITLPNKDGGQYFYWYFESLSKPSDDPFVLWLTVGPGCSSLWAQLAENGPCHVEPDHSTPRNPFAWNTNSNVIWLDQPTFTGYSYGNNPQDEYTDATNVRANVYLFLQGFLAHIPRSAAGHCLSRREYCGHCIPLFTHYIWTCNTQLMTAADQSKRINLQSIAIGNGLTAATIQYTHYLDIANNSYGTQLATDPERLALARANVTECVYSIRDYQIAGSVECIKALDTCYMTWSRRSILRPEPVRHSPRLQPSQLVDCYDPTHITEYLNDAAIETYYRIPQDKVPTWVECSDQVSKSFNTSGDYLADH